ncbi:hypothetical protein BJ165DRAFT_1399953 [Panaeolus papilionaceus]|nr:hypothetical protein BJ165DRAFT_1399953 [Panaeolus papilionaceus]
MNPSIDTCATPRTSLEPYALEHEPFSAPSGQVHPPGTPFIITFDYSRVFNFPNTPSYPTSGVFMQDLRTDLQRVLFLRDWDTFFEKLNSNGPGIMKLVISWPGYRPLVYPVISLSGYGNTRSKLLEQVTHAFDMWFREVARMPVPHVIRGTKFEIGPGKVHRDQIIVVGLTNIFGNYWQPVVKIDPRVEEVVE